MPRSRRVLAWTGVVLTAVTVSAWPASMVCSISHSRFVGTGGVKRDVGVWSGGVGVSSTNILTLSRVTPEMFERGWRVHVGARSVGWLPACRWWSSPRRFFPDHVHVPLWIPVVILGALTTWLWRTSASHGVTACRGCGYDQAGLPADAVCPECGTPAKARVLPQRDPVVAG